MGVPLSGGSLGLSPLELGLTTQGGIPNKFFLIDLFFLGGINMQSISRAGHVKLFFFGGRGV
jgi:hypothetical protein